jgi:hypothetical protein
MAPAAANAHIRSGVVAVDYRASVFPLRAQLRAALAVRVYESDRALGLTVRSGHTVVVLGYLGEAFLRVSSAGVAVNEASPTAGAVGLLKRRRRPAGAGPVWHLQVSGRTVVWHDARVRALPPGVQRGQWTVPLVVDGRRVRLEGELWRVRRPSPWPWLALGTPFVALTALVLLTRGMPRLRRASVAFGAVAAAGTIGTAAGFAFDPNASPARWVEGGNELLFALVGLAVVARGSSNARAVAGGALGLLGLSVGLSKVPVLFHGVVLSALPGTVARVAVVITIWAGAAATAVGVALFFELLEEPLVLTLGSDYRRRP